MHTRRMTEPPATPTSPDYIVAMDFGGTKIHVATADLQGNLLHQEILDTLAERGAEQTVERALVAARRVMSRTPDGRCMAAGIASPGVISARGILLAPNLPGWERLALADLTRDGLGISPVVIGNDVKAAAAAEFRWGNLRGADPALFLSLGTGIGAAAIVGGQVLMGAHGAAGEIGYTVAGRSADFDAAPTLSRVLLEDIVGGRSLGEQGGLLLGNVHSAADLFASSDPRARRLVESALAALAVALANLVLLIDPARIAVGGGLVGSGRMIVSTLKEEFHKTVPFPPEIIIAHFLADSALRGAILLALQAVAMPDTLL